MDHVFPEPTAVDPSFPQHSPDLQGFATCPGCQASLALVLSAAEPSMLSETASEICDAVCDNVLLGRERVLCSVWIALVFHPKLVETQRLERFQLALQAFEVAQLNHHAFHAKLAILCHRRFRLSGTFRAPQLSGRDGDLWHDLRDSFNALVDRKADTEGTLASYRIKG